MVTLEENNAVIMTYHLHATALNSVMEFNHTLDVITLVQIYPTIITTFIVIFIRAVVFVDVLMGCQLNMLCCVPYGRAYLNLTLNQRRHIKN